MFLLFESEVGIQPKGFECKKAIKTNLLVPIKIYKQIYIMNVFVYFTIENYLKIK